jgi:OPT oligopeptide transporter protein
VQDLSLDDYDDPNFDPTATLLQDESPYVEVRAAVANTDDPRMPSSTFRAWTIGLIWTILLSGINQALFFRYPTVGIDTVRDKWSPKVILRTDWYGQIVALLLSFPMGKAWARYTPNVSIFGISLNPGPFTIKEHVIIVAMSSIISNGGPAYAVGTDRI